jgi:muconolactone delta-isomerase
MNHYLVVIDLPGELSNEFLALIPEQRRHVNTLMGEGKVLQYSLAADHSRIWTTVFADSDKQAREIVGSFPLARFMQFSVRELAFHLHAGRNLLHVSLN